MAILAKICNVHSFCYIAFTISKYCLFSFIYVLNEESQLKPIKWLFTIYLPWSHDFSKITCWLWWHSKVFFLSLKKPSLVIATWMDLDIVILSKVRQRKTNIIWYRFYIESKIWHTGTYLQTEADSDIEHSLMVARGRGGEGGGLGVGGLLMQIIMYRMDKQWGPIVQHRELYSICCDNPQ